MCGDVLLECNQKVGRAAEDGTESWKANLVGYAKEYMFPQILANAGQYSNGRNFELL